MLGQHPQMYGLPELQLFVAEKVSELWSNDKQSFEKGVALDPIRRHGLLRAVAQLFAGEQSIQSITMARHWVAARIDKSTREVYREIVARITPLIPVEKSPSYVSKPEFLQRLYETFPNARFIHLIRHPMGQCKSVMNMRDGMFALLVDSVDYSGEKAILDPQIAWHDFHLNITDFLDQVPSEQWLRIRGEDFLNDTDVYLRRVCDWLGLRTDEEAVEQMKHPEDSPYASIGPVNALFGNDPNFLRNPIFRQGSVHMPSLEGPLPWRPDGKGFFPEVIELARGFGYPVENESIRAAS